MSLMMTVAEVFGPFREGGGGEVLHMGAHAGLRLLGELGTAAVVLFTVVQSSGTARASAATLILCMRGAMAQDAALKAAVVKCVEEEPTGNCTCAGTSCSADPRFQGPIGTWDVSGVEDMDFM